MGSTAGSAAAVPQQAAAKAKPSVKFAPQEDDDEYSPEDLEYEQMRAQLRLRMQLMKEKQQKMQKEKLMNAKVAPWQKANEEDTESLNSSRSYKQIPGDFMGSNHWIAQ